MAVPFRILCRENLKKIYIQNITKPVQWNITANHPIRFLCNEIKYQNSILRRPSVLTKDLTLSLRPFRQCTSQHSNNPCKPPQEPEKKVGLIQRFKQMYKDYWYVLLPVHMTTSALWFGGFYYCVRRYFF